MTQRYEIRELPRKVPQLIGRALAYAGGYDAFVSDGGFYNPDKNTRRILVNGGEGMVGITALLGRDRTDVVIEGKGECAKQVRDHYAVNRAIAKSSISFRRAA